jgi:ferredoxin
MAALLTSLDPLVAALRADGRQVIGPTVRDGAIVLAELDSARQLPYGWGVRVSPGGYRLRQRDDRAAFGHSAGPQSWKTYLHPPRTELWSMRRGESPVEPDEAPPRYAFLGVRPCDLRAIAVLDRVLGQGKHPSARYAARRAATFIVAVNCTEPGEACFCVSAGGGPKAATGYDLVLTELIGAETVRYLIAAGSDAGRHLLSTMDAASADAAAIAEADTAVDAAAGRMGRALPPGDLRALIAGTRGAARWDDVASRCLACANCTMVCPTCFCTTVEDTTDLTGEVAGRWQRWDSCFDPDFSYLHGGAVRSSTRSRYRQWLSHKVGTWHDQFGESGCVGCGRCIAWCPVGIDLTAELTALASEEGHRVDDR